MKATASYNKRVSSSRGCTPPAQMFGFALHFTYPPAVMRNRGEELYGEDE